MSGQGTKRKQRSGLTGVELEVAILALDQLAKKSREEMQRNQGQNEEIDNVPLVDKDEEASVLDQIEALRRVLEARTVGPSVCRVIHPMSQSYSFSSVKNEFLEAMNIRRSGTLELKADASDLAAKMDSIGSDSLWTLDLLFNHLLHLEKLVPRSNEAAARLWINAYFYRISAMIPEGQKMGLSMEQVVPSVTLSNRSLHSVSGYIYYTASVMAPENLPAFLDAPILRPDDSLLFVSEAKDFVDLGRHIPQAIAEMLGCARRSKKEIIRGVLTDGRKWIFLILTLHSDGSFSFIRSVEINDHKTFTNAPSRAGVSLISAILAHWIIHSHEAFDGATDFFVG